jgi:hypothetical protein
MSIHEQFLLSGDNIKYAIGHTLFNYVVTIALPFGPRSVGGPSLSTQEGTDPVPQIICSVTKR